MTTTVTTTPTMIVVTPEEEDTSLPTRSAGLLDDRLLGTGEVLPVSWDEEVDGMPDWVDVDFACAGLVPVPLC